MPEVHVLFFEGCPNHEPAVQLAREVLAELGLAAELKEVAIQSPQEADQLRFLGSPSIRVNGRDIEPGAEERTDFALSCRMYGRNGLPPREWMIAALKSA